jgi:ABC-2 type transport system ATP-binding protein
MVMTIKRVELIDVSKRLKKKQILEHIHLSVAAHEVVGIVGANGSGKTTLLQLMTGLIYADQGTVWVDGKRVLPGLLGNLPTTVGALIESPAFLPQFSGLKNLYLLAGIREKIDQAEVREVMKKVGLDHMNRRAVRTYSLGMKQRLGIAQAIMEKPEVVLLDEPTNSLDREGVEIFAACLREQVKRGAGVILVSHIREEIDRFCDRVYHLCEGKLEMVRQSRERYWRVIAPKFADIEKIYNNMKGFQLADRIDGRPAGVLKGTYASREEVKSELHKWAVDRVEIEEMEA